MNNAGFVRAMNGRMYKYTAYQHNWGTGSTRWFVRMGDYRYIVTRNDEELPGIFKLYREWLVDGNTRNDFLGYAPTTSFALRIAATETQRLVAGTREEATVAQ